jgi:hypothetical protein
MVKTKILGMVVGAVIVYGAFLWLTGSSAFVREDVDTSNRFYSYSHEDLEKACDAMSSFSYVSGLTDGALIATPFTGRTYYYKSRCYYELARRTGRAEFCKKVKERNVFFGEGSGVSENACLRTVALASDAQAMRTREAERHAAAVDGAVKIERTSVAKVTKESWEIRVDTEGSLAGEYRFDVASLNQNRVLVSETVFIKEPRASFTWIIERSALLDKTSRLPAIFPISVSLNYLMPQGSAEPTQEYLSSVGNATLSVE